MTGQDDFQKQIADCANRFRLNRMTGVDDMTTRAGLYNTGYPVAAIQAGKERADSGGEE